MIKVLNIIDELRRGGKERQFIELLKGIDKAKYQMHTISFLERKDGYDKKAKILSFNFCYMPRRFRWDLFLIYDLRKYCKNEKIDIIYSWDGMTAFYAYFAVLFLRTKFINGSIRDTDERRNYKRLFKVLILKLSRNIVANSYAGLETYGVENKGTVIYNGLDLDRFKGLEKQTHNKFIIGIVANLTEYKDYYTFFNAIKLLSAQGHDFEVHVVGGGKMSETYKTYSGKSGISSFVKFFGRVENAENYIINFDIGVLCSYKEKGEGLSNSVLEYMACGVPPIITDIGAAGEIIEEGVTGYLFDAGNAKDLAEKILFLMKDKNLREKTGNKAKEVVFEKFAYKRYIEEIENYYAAVLIEN